jgi:hypothetical protein
MSRSRVLVIVLIFFLGVAYLQTGHGFRHVLLPIANGFVPGRLSVESGRLGLTGTLEAKAVELDSQDLGIQVAVGDFFVSLSIISLLWGPPHIEELRLYDVDVSIAQREGEEESPAKESEEQGIERFLALPLHATAADVQRVRVQLLQDDVTWSDVKTEHLSITSLTAGETGRISSVTTVVLTPPEEGDLDYAGEIELQAEIAQTSGGRIEGWKVSVMANVSGLLDSGQTDDDPTTFTIDSSGEIGTDLALTAQTRLVAKRGSTLLGEVDTSISTMEGPEGRVIAKASAQLQSLSEGFLNPLIAPLRRGHIDRAKISGDFEVTADLPLDVSQPPRRAKAQVSIERFDYRTLRVAQGLATLDFSADSIVAELAPTRINRGRLSGKLNLDSIGSEQKLAANVQASKLDLAAIARAFREDMPTAIEGILDLSATLASQAPPDADLRKTANGNVEVHLKGGRIEGFNIMSFLAEQSGVEAFKAIPLDDFDVDASPRIENGVAYLEEAVVKAAAAELLINGSVALMGSADLTIEAFVGPSIATTLSRFGVKMDSVRTYERLTSVPVAIGVSGPFDDLSYGPTQGRTIDRAGDAVDAGSGAVDDSVKGVVDWLRKKQKK